MPNYTKLFSSIVTSTIWTEDDKTRIVWITLLALADQNGEIHASVPGLARVAGVAVPDVENAVALFLNPDKFSRTKDYEGRRIAEIDGGWELLNHAKYRRMASKEDAKEANAARQRRHRARNASVTHRNASVTQTRDIAEAEAEAEAEKSENLPSVDSLPPTKRVAWSEEGFTGLIGKDWERWKKAYPAVDLKVEIEKASEWLLANPQKKKKQPYRFLTNWFSRKQERGGTAQSNKPNGATSNPFGTV